MEKTVLIIDDVKDQADGLAKALAAAMPKYSFEAYSSEADIKRSIEERFYSLAIVDIRMDQFQFNGLDIIKRIFEVNPFANIIVVSAFKDEYFKGIKEVMLSGKVVDVLEKEELRIWIPKLEAVISKYYNQIENDPSEINNALLQYYADAKNEKDTYEKGQRFEHFISLLFQSFGYKEITKRKRDKSSNEVDLIIRNETDDTFLNKFGKYILIECKNKPEDRVSKNDFIVFLSKVSNSNGLCEFGIIATSGYIAKTTYIEAVRTSQSQQKIMFISNPEIERLIRSLDKKEEFKRLIDEQVKDN
jgi:CheY-like chemotaxis protein